MYIIFEGIEGTGKSTLARSLSQRLVKYHPYVDMFNGWEGELRLNGRERSPIPGVGDAAEDLAVMYFVHATGASAIQDRGLVSALVYREARGERLPVEGWWDKVWSMVPRTVVVHVKRDIEACLAVREAGPFGRYRLEREDAIFDKVVAALPVRTIIVNNDGNIDGAVETIWGELYRISPSVGGLRPAPARLP